MAIVYNQINADNCKKIQKVSFKTKNDRYFTKMKLLKKKEVEGQSCYHVVGDLKVKDKIEEMPRNVDMLNLDKYEYPLISKKPKGCRIIGYIQVAEDDYIAVVKFSFIQILLPLIILLFFILGWLYRNSVIDIPVIADTVTKVTDNTPKVNNEKIVFAGFGSNYKFSKGDKFYLSNPEGNTVYMIFTISDENGKELYKSELVPSGRFIETDPYEVFEPGKTTIVNIHVDTYDSDDYDNSEKMTKCSPMNFKTVNITLE